PQKKICEEALDAMKRLTNLLSTGHPERESIREAQREASLATARLVEDRHDYILTTIASSTALATYTEKEKAEWGDFLSCNNRLLELIASKEQEESALTTDIHDFRCTASTYVS